jgi:hypothetical protein
MIVKAQISTSVVAACLVLALNQAQGPAQTAQKLPLMSRGASEPATSLESGKPHLADQSIGTPIAFTNSELGFLSAIPLNSKPNRQSH